MMQHYIVESEITTKIVIAAIHSDKFSLNSAKDVADFYNTIFTQVVSIGSEAEKNLNTSRSFNV